MNEAFQQRLRLWHAILLVSNDHCKLPLLLEIAVEREISSMNFFKNIELRAQQVRTPQLFSNLKTRNIKIIKIAGFVIFVFFFFFFSFSCNILKIYAVDKINQFFLSSHNYTNSFNRNYSFKRLFSSYHILDGFMILSLE